MSLQVKQVFYWGIASMALLALAGPYPDLATGFVVLLIAGVLINHYRDYQQYLTPPK